MKGYLVGVIATATLVSLASLFLRGKEVERAGKIAFGLILLTALLLPLGDLLPTLWEKLAGEPTLPSVTEDGTLYETVGKEAFEDGIARAVAEKFSIPKEKITVRAEGFDFSSMRAQKILLTLRGRGAFADPKKIAAYITGAGLGECEVDFEIG
ncbi:MAG TPA: hypothetical protein DDY70_06225 [Clostridiales bacterium]|nr:hypothetical protein [Clostridiales bacterium]